MATLKLVDKLLSKAHTIAIGGHRGCGENLLSTPGRVEPAFRENTLASFKQAAALGVNFIEFDVQVTSDGVPVLWHDDAIITQCPGQPASVCEVKDRSLSEFRALVQGRGADSSTQLVRTFRNRETRQHTAGLVEWRCTNDDSLPTLEQLFQVMPECVGFDVEVKMTVPDTVLATSEEEVTRVVIPIVQCVEAMANSNRNIIYSSFDPDVCIKLAQLQYRHEVYYLSGCGIYPHVDPRRTSVSTALEFAAHHRLAGVVVPASILMSNQELVSHAHAKGLKVLTYGLENNSKAAVERQQELGVHAAIVDDVENTLPDLIRVAYEEEEAMGTYGVGIVA